MAKKGTKPAKAVRSMKSGGSSAADSAAQARGWGVGCGRLFSLEGHVVTKAEATAWLDYIIMLASSMRAAINHVPDSASWTVGCEPPVE
jgi:hypothetical protein